MKSIDTTKRKGPAGFHFSSSAQNWQTPDFIFNALHYEFGFTVDAAASETNAKLPRYWTISDSGLDKDWSSEVVFANPPYNEAGKWMKKAWVESRKGATAVLLVPARCDNTWWHLYAMKAEIRFFTFRLSFTKSGKGSNRVAPFPSCVVVFRPPSLVIKSFGRVGFGLMANNKKGQMAPTD